MYNKQYYYLMVFDIIFYFREEATVMEHLRRIVGDMQLDKNFIKKEADLEEVIVNQDVIPLLSEKVFKNIHTFQKSLN